jgi:hypothetical protein
MTKFNQDGNLLGRVCALAIIVAAVVGVGRVSGLTASCCATSGGHCETPADLSK